jgi:hypothetical protein
MPGQAPYPQHSTTYQPAHRVGVDPDANSGDIHDKAAGPEGEDAREAWSAPREAAIIPTDAPGG